MNSLLILLTKRKRKGMKIYSKGTEHFCVHKLTESTIFYGASGVMITQRNEVKHSDHVRLSQNNFSLATQQHIFKRAKSSFSSK
jgi:hypothetical protein